MVELCQKKRKGIDLIANIIEDFDNSETGKLFLSAEKRGGVWGLPDTGSLWFYSHKKLG